MKSTGARYLRCRTPLKVVLLVAVCNVLNVALLSTLLAKNSRGRNSKAQRDAFEVRLETEHDFKTKMEQAGIPCQHWVDGERRLVDDLPWVMLTTSWWNSTGQRSLSHDSLRDMQASPNLYYQALARAYVAGNLSQAAKLLSPFTDGLDSWPAVAFFENAVVFPEGHVRNDSVSFQGKGCGPFESRSLPDEDPPRFKVVATIAHFWGTGYYHFVCENLVRLPLILPVVESFHGAKLHVNGMPGFVIEFLEAIGIQRSQVIDGVVAADLALVPEPVPCGNPPAVMLNLLRRTLVRRVLAKARPPSAACELLVVKRKTGRAISNHDQLVSALNASFSACRVDVHTGEESVVEQLHMFRRATVVVAPHGAGLANLMACRARTLVMEFMTAGRDVNICYMSMALKLGLHYAMLTVPGSTHGEPMTVDVERSISFLQALPTDNDRRAADFLATPAAPLHSLLGAHAVGPDCGLEQAVDAGVPCRIPIQK